MMSTQQDMQLTVTAMSQSFAEMVGPTGDDDHGRVKRDWAVLLPDDIDELRNHFLVAIKFLGIIHCASAYWHEEPVADYVDGYREQILVDDPRGLFRSVPDIEFDL